MLKTNKNVGILDKPLNKSRPKVSTTPYVFLFGEIVKYAQHKAKNTNEFQEILSNFGRFVGRKSHDSIYLKEKGYKRDNKFHNVLLFIKGPMWKNLWGKEVDKVEKSNEDPCKYFFFEKEPVINTYISQRKDKTDINCATFNAGIIEAILTELGYACKVSAHWHNGTTYMIVFEEDYPSKETSTKTK
uniref:Trafficking protein particle complex subunit 5 n=1 Tax=Parastrongyloides trichosuri TaxID=131310 RepID=A0A0N4ZSW8_PARTI